MKNPLPSGVTLAGHILACFKEAATLPQACGNGSPSLIRRDCYGQPTHRYLTDLTDRDLPISPGTVAGGLHYLAPLFETVMEALYCKRMSEQLFHNDETRREVFGEIAGTVGSRWYLWVTRSASVIFYCIDPSRIAAVPGAHFAGLQHDQVIIVCDRYSAYKKLARLALNILLAFCWAHVRRDFLNAGRALAELEPWALECKARIGTLYHLNALRLQHWNPNPPLSEQSEAFNEHHEALKATLQLMHEEATRGGGAGSPLIQERANQTEAGVNEPARALAGADGVCRASSNPHG